MLSYYQVSFCGSIIVIPPSMLMDKIFRMSRPRIKLPPPPQSGKEGDEAAETVAEKMRKANERSGKGAGMKKRRSLPWWCKYIGEREKGLSRLTCVADGFWDKSQVRYVGKRDQIREYKILDGYRTMYKC